VDAPGSARLAGVRRRHGGISAPNHLIADALVA
jgi:hypothetical protein